MLWAKSVPSTKKSRKWIVCLISFFQNVKNCAFLSNELSPIQNCCCRIVSSEAPHPQFPLGNCSFSTEINSLSIHCLLSLYTIKKDPHAAAGSIWNYYKQSNASSETSCDKPCLPGTMLNPDTLAHARTRVALCLRNCNWKIATDVICIRCRAINKKISLQWEEHNIRLPPSLC